METKPAMDRQYLQLMQQLVDLKKENLALWKEGLCGQPNMSENWYNLQ